MSDSLRSDSSLKLRISVVYALPGQQYQVTVRLAEAATVNDAIERSGLRQRFPELSQRPLDCAIFGRVVPLSAALRDGDRVEILRPLLIDPKENRRQAAARARRK
jgi:putative ubiquitin-RnfH superfamily antitoxin RatB of RatAB toxin-antitoxin module